MIKYNKRKEGAKNETKRIQIHSTHNTQRPDNGR